MEAYLRRDWGLSVVVDTIPAMATHPTGPAPAHDDEPFPADLRDGLAGLPDGGGLDPVARSGPRRWWAGPLDVEGLAVGSVRLALTAAQALGRLRGWVGALSTSGDLVGSSFDSIRQLRVDGRQPEGFAPLSGYYPTRDGWVRLHGNYPHHAAAIEATVGTADPDGVAERLRERGAEEVEAAIRAAGGAAAMCRSPGQWRDTPMAAAVAGEPWIRYDVGDGTGRRELPTASRLPLEGLRVLDLTRVIAGPTGGRLLAQLGADVLRLDPPHRPELLDQHLDTGFGKRSAYADLRDPAVRDRIHRLLGSADVLLTGYRPGALRTFGLAQDQVRARHPHAVMVSLSAWGWSGPWAGQRGFDSLVQAATGIGDRYANSTGTATGGTSPAGVGAGASRRPGALPVQALDHATGYGMAAAACVLLANRPRAGGGAARLSLARTAQLLMDLPPVDAPAEQIHPERCAVDSPHGRLEHVPGPVLLDGATLSYPGAPDRYGTAELTWTSR